VVGTRSRAADESDPARAELISQNVLGGDLDPCGTDPLTGFYRDGDCTTGVEDVGSHTVCAVVTEEFLDHQRQIGNDLTTPMPEYRFPGLVPGDRWCVTATNWLRAHFDGMAAPVVLASTHERALEIIPLDVLQEYAVDVPSDPGSLGI
jgi:uncharacterized protein